MPTVRDVARKAGVSPITVSRVVNDAASVSAETAERVRSAIRELGYVPNVAAQGLRSKRTHALALIVPDITNPFWTTVARGVEDAAQRSDYWVFLGNTDEDPGKQARYLAVIAGQRVDGVIIAPCNRDPENLGPLLRAALPTVVMDRRVAGWEGDWIGDDSIANARAVVRILLCRGHRRIAAVSGPPGASTADERLLGYRLALHEAGLPVERSLVKRREFRAGSGEHAITELMALPEPPTAIFAANHAIGDSLVAACEAQGLRVPADVEVVCFDAQPQPQHRTRCEVVVAHPAYEMGVHAAGLLLGRIESREPPPARTITLPGRVLADHGRTGGYECAGETVDPLDPEERRAALEGA